MCATISTSPDLASVATPVTRPSASNFGAKAQAFLDLVGSSRVGANAASSVKQPDASRVRRAMALVSVAPPRSMVMKRTCSFGSSRNAPVNCVVTVSAPGFSTPRSDMHMCSASIITATPRGFRISSIAVAICEVRCSCVCSRRA